jgi:hypothetical protein
MDNANLPALLQDTTLALNPAILSKLDTWEDFLDFYVELEKASTATSWWKADLLAALYDKFGHTSLEELAKSVNQPYSTIINYVRTARAFPVEKRVLDASFTIHFQASFADQYGKKADTDKEEFAGEERFKWVEKAADEKLSVRQLHEQIQQTKQLKELGTNILPCYICRLDTGEIFLYNFYSAETRRESDRFNLHKDCYYKLIEWMDDQHN